MKGGKKLMKRNIIAILSSLASFVFVISTISNGTASTWMLHETKVPESVAKL
jgi:cyclic lactone autoinducer peptide